MSRKVNRVRVSLDPKGIKSLPPEEIAAILRGADDLIMSGGRNLLAKILKGSRDKTVLERGLEQSPVYGVYRHLKEEAILARIDWVIVRGYLDIEYDWRLPLLVYTPKGWEIEKETYSDELLGEFDTLLALGTQSYDMTYLVDKNRDLIWLLLDKIAETKDRKYIPILEAWEAVDYKKVRARIRQVIDRISQEESHESKSPEE